MTVSSQGTYKNLIEMLDNSRKLYADRPLFGTKRTEFMSGLLMSSLQKR
ncbi:MAG: hypothetical protein Ct9H300mP28_13430 [Pseudomonadota bacterium]|nr:MAG: hypothetical protein Ct9H300mP28_13430 [Pseudomonadota bacterium]